MKKLLLAIVLIVGCAVKLDIEYPKKKNSDELRELNACYEECEPYDRFSSWNEVYNPLRDSLKHIYSKMQTDDPHCMCLRYCMQTDSICGAVYQYIDENGDWQLDFEKQAYPTIGD